MRYILAIFLPFIVFFTIGKPFSGIIALILQITILGWFIATIWAMFAVNDYHTKKLFRASIRDSYNP